MKTTVCLERRTFHAASQPTNQPTNQIYIQFFLLYMCMCPSVLTIKIEAKSSNGTKMRSINVKKKEN